MPEKAVYSLTEAGEKQLKNLMFEIAAKPIQIFLDFNAVIVNLDALSPEEQMKCLTDIEANVNILKSYLEENLQEKENIPEIPQTGLAVLRQQFLLAQAVETWVASLKANVPFERKTI